MAIDKESTLFKDIHGQELFLGDVVRAPIEDPFTNLHGDWAEYEIGKGAGGYTLLYFRSEKGCQMPFGYTACFMNEFQNEVLDIKYLFWATNLVPHPRLEKIDSEFTMYDRRELFAKESKLRR